MEVREETHRLLETIYACTAAGLLAAFGAATLEGVLVVRNVAGAASAFLIGFGLYGPFGLLMGLGIGLLLGGVRATLHEPMPALFSILRRRPELDARIAASVMAVASCLALEVVLVDAFARGSAASMANRRLAALAIALVAGGGTLMAGLLALSLHHLYVPLARMVPRARRLPATAAIGVLAILGVAGAAALILRRIDWRVLRLEPWELLGGLVVTTALIFAWIVRFRSFWRQPTACMLAVAIGIMAGIDAPRWGRDEAAIGAIQQHGLFLPLLVSAARWIGDRDKDGYSAWFNGGDCNDHDSRVHPGAQDVPANGVDENCSGGDAHVTVKHVPTRRSIVAADAEETALRSNILLVCIDTLRADELGAMGHEAGLTPNLDALAKRGVLFRRAHSQAANTPQSFPSVFTSLYPSRVPWVRQFVSYPSIRQDAVTVFEQLRQAGYRTLAFTSHFYFTEQRGIRQGFDEWDNSGATSLRDSNKDVASPRIVPKAIAALNKLAVQNQRFAMFVHLFEPHSTYVRHSEFPYRRRGVAGLREKYDFEVKFADQWLGRLIAGLGQVGLKERTAVILFSDHGEAFGEHRFYFHGQALYEEVLHVPLILVAPGIHPREVNTPVALLDIAPTLLELAGAEIPTSFQGQSLLPLARGQTGAERRRLGAVLLPYPAWPQGQQAMVDGRYKALMRITDNRFELYDLRSDPQERRNLAFTDPALTKRLQTEYAQFAEQELQ